MYLGWWGLRECPFSRDGYPPAYLSAAQDEALARMLFLVQHGRRAGLMGGSGGSGKSFVLRAAARQLRQLGCQVAYVSLMDVGGQEFLAHLAGGWGVWSDASVSSWKQWQAIADRLVEHRCLGVSSVALLDDVDRAESEVLAHVHRLAATEPAGDARPTVILSGRPEGLARLDRRLLELVDLRIEIEPFTAMEVAEYVESSLRAAGRREPLFEADAVRALHRLSSGIPRNLNRMAQLALAACADARMTSISSLTLSRVHQELSPADEVLTIG